MYIEHRDINTLDEAIEYLSQSLIYYKGYSPRRLFKFVKDSYPDLAKKYEYLDIGNSYQQLLDDLKCQQ